MEEFLHRVCDMHERILKYPLTKDVFTMYVLISIISFIIFSITGGR